MLVTLMRTAVRVSAPACRANARIAAQRIRAPRALSMMQAAQAAPQPHVIAPGIEIVQWQESQTRMEASREFAANEMVGEAHGLPICSRASIFTVQAGKDVHVQPEGSKLEKANHSCSPNCAAIVDSATGTFALRAIRPIAAGEAISFDYETTEWSMDEPFACRCGSPSCRGTIAGWKHMRPADQTRLLPKAAPHIQKMHWGVK
jgi:hypothetical protein